jgi:hypothetical protein
LIHLTKCFWFFWFVKSRTHPFSKTLYFLFVHGLTDRIDESRSVSSAKPNILHFSWSLPEFSSAKSDILFFPILAWILLFKIKHFLVYLIDQKFSTNIARSNTFLIDQKIQNLASNIAKSNNLLHFFYSIQIPKNYPFDRSL